MNKKPFATRQKIRRPIYRRGNIRIPTHTHPCVKRLVEEMNRQQTTLEEVAARSGMHAQTLRCWITRTMPRIDNVAAVANVLGYEMHLRPIREEGIDG